MFMKTSVVLIFLQNVVIQVYAKMQVLTAPAAAVESQLINLREGQRLLSDELHQLYEKMDGLETNIFERMNGIETNMLEKIKNLLCTGCKGNTTTTTTTTTQNTNTKQRSCKDWLQDTGRSDIYLIKPSAKSNLTFKAYCLIKKDDLETTFWTVILRRVDGSVNYNRNWKDYQRGFGNLNGEFILGLDYIHALTQSDQQELLIELERKDGRKGYAKYDNFRIGNSHQSYVLKSLGHFSGNIYDAMSYHLGYRWSTKDVKNDKAHFNCAEHYGGGWWYNYCQYSCLTGRYNLNQIDGKGSDWHKFTRVYSDIKYALMVIRQL